MPELQIEGRVLAWARTQRGISPAEAARRLGMSEGELSALEAGRPVLKQSTIRRIATKYKVNYGSLFMPEPLPVDEPKQYRTFKGRPPKLGEKTLLAWADVNDAVDSFADLRVADPNLVKVADLPRISTNDDIETAAIAERLRLRVTIAQQHVWTEAQARDGWRAALESVGVFVYFFPMPIRDCMGFSILDERGIPAICVNDNKDLLERQKIFTIIHEYCHLLLRLPGISDQGKGNAVERFCNQFAAALLIPREPLRRLLPGGGPLRDWTTQELKRVANRFNVSMEAIALRIEDLEMAPSGFHDRKVADWNQRGLLAKRLAKGHPNVTWPERAARRLGRKHTLTVFGALDSGAISFSEARGLIGLPARHFANVRLAVE